MLTLKLLSYQFMEGRRKSGQKAAGMREGKPQP